MIQIKTKYESVILKYLNIFFLTYFFMTFVFSRSFTGIYIKTIRIGEIAFFLSFLLFFLFIFFNSEQFNTKILGYDFKYLIIVITLTFLLFVYMSEASLFSSYTYKTSTYIWSISALFLGACMKKVAVNSKQVVIIQSVLVMVYYIAIFDLPESVIEVFLQYSDKYEPHKGSDIGIFFILANMLILRFDDYKKLSLNIFFINLGLFLPLTLYKSRGAFLGVLIYVLYELFVFYKSKKLLRINNIPIFILLMIITTTSTILSQTKDFPEEISTVMISNSYSSLGEYRLQHYQEEYPLLYIENNRVYSGDGNLNWRLSMWQDQIDFMKKEKLIIQGSGYNNKLYVFDIDNTGYGNDRTGLDNTNENIHNFFIQILSRGGLIHLLIFIFLFYKILVLYRKNLHKSDILFYVVPLLLISSFDSSMENAHFPLIFYYFLGNFYFEKKQKIV